MGTKVGLTYEEKIISVGCSVMWCWWSYLDLRGR